LNKYNLYNLYTMGNLITIINNFFYPKEPVDLLLENYRHKMAVDKIKFPDYPRNGNRFFTEFYPNSSL